MWCSHLVNKQHSMSKNVLALYISMAETSISCMDLRYAADSGYAIACSKYVSLSTKKTKRWQVMQNIQACW